MKIWVFPTYLVCELAGVQKPAHVEFKSLMPLIRGEKKTQYDRIYGKYINTQRMIVKGDWKLIFYTKAKKKKHLCEKHTLFCASTVICCRIVLR